MDNSAISNFAAVGRMDILRERYGGRLVVTREVLLEAERGPCPEALRRAVREGWVELRIIYADSEEHGAARAHVGRWGTGEGVKSRNAQRAWYRRFG